MGLQITSAVDISCTLGTFRTRSCFCCAGQWPVIQRRTGPTDTTSLVSASTILNWPRKLPVSLGCHWITNSITTHGQDLDTICITDWTEANSQHMAGRPLWTSRLALSV